MRMRSGAWGGRFPSGVRMADKPSQLTKNQETRKVDGCMGTHFLNPWLHHNRSPSVLQLLGKDHEHAGRAVSFVPLCLDNTRGSELIY